MKKTIIIALITLILLVPIPFILKDGGSVEYKALIYKLTKVHRLNETSTTGYEKGWQFEILGIKIYDKVTYEKKSDLYQVEVNVIDLKDNTMFVEVLKSTEGFHVKEQISVNVSQIEKETKDLCIKGSKVIITYNGDVLTSYPPQINALKVEIIE